MPDCWRIDQLAQETGLTVDTIRYYQRQGLLPPGEREGRHRLYGPEHVRRLTKIKELQARRFSIAAIHALVSGDNDRLDSLFADEGEGFRYTFAELVERSEAGPELVHALKDAGVLRDPEEFGRVAYDGDDLEMLRAVGELARAGVPTNALQALGRIYAEGIEATQRRIVEVFVSGGDIEFEGDEVDRLREVAEQRSDVLLSTMRRLVDYTHHRTIQRLTLDAVGRTTEPDPDATDPDATDELPVA